MTDDTRSVPPSETTQQEDKVEDAIHEQAAEELANEPEVEVVSIEELVGDEDDGD